MKVVYIAGPFRASSHWDVEQNIRRAEQLALDAWRTGVAVICPHTNTRFFDGAAPDALWLEGDLEILRRCDAVLMTSDWERSNGARNEHALAEALPIPIFYDVDSLKRWVNGG